MPEHVYAFIPLYIFLAYALVRSWQDWKEALESGGTEGIDEGREEVCRGKDGEGVA